MTGLDTHEATHGARGVSKHTNHLGAGIDGRSL